MSTDPRSIRPSPGSSSPYTQLPPFALRLLFDALTALAEGHAVTWCRCRPKLTTQEAADILNVSRPYLIKLLDERKIPYRRVGNRRKVMLKDVLRYKRSDDQFRQGILDELSEKPKLSGSSTDRSGQGGWRSLLCSMRTFFTPPRSETC